MCMCMHVHVSTSTLLCVGAGDGVHEFAHTCSYVYLFSCIVSIFVVFYITLEFSSSSLLLHNDTGTT